MREIEKYGQEMMDEQYVILKDNSRNILTPNINQQEFARLLSQTRMYSANEDVDVIMSDGHYQEALLIKRHRAEEKLIKLRIIVKMSKKLQLSSKEK